MKTLMGLVREHDEKLERIAQAAENRNRAGRKRPAGRRTDCMQRQFAAFKAFLAKTGHVYDGKPPYAAATRFWNSRTATFDKAAKASGRNKGYSSHKPLADAYHADMAKGSVR